MTEIELVIPSPKELKEKVEEENREKSENVTEFAKKLLANAAIAAFLMESKRLLYTERSKIKKELKTNAEDLSAAKIYITDLNKPIKEILKEYNVIVEENAVNLTLMLTISIPAGFFAQETENK